MDPSMFLQYGGIGLAGLTIWLSFRLIGNHISHRDAEFKGVIKDNTESNQELRDVVLELKNLINILISKK